VPITAHAAFDKAAHFFRIRIHHVPVDPHTKQVNTRLLKSYINSNTCMVSVSDLEKSFYLQSIIDITNPVCIKEPKP
jgi:hypothetical protein